MNALAPAFDRSKVTEIRLAENCGVNTSEEVLLEQVRANCARGLPQVQPFEPNDEVALLVCGGPSLEENFADLREAHWAGGKIVAVNGAYQWCIDRNLRPSAMIMLDAREFNARFVETPVPQCKYFLASQCHPRAFELCERRETYLWHAIGTGTEHEVEFLKEYYFERIHPVTLGTTVGIRAISLLRLLGFQRLDIFGLDSCFLDDAHHGYAQPENDADGRIPVWLGESGRRFVCAPWHVKQASDFLDLVKERGDMFQLSVRGRGLIAAMLETGAELRTE